IPVIIGSFLTRVGGTHRTARRFSPKVTERLHTMTGWMRERLRCSADRAFENRLSFERRRFLGPPSLLRRGPPLQGTAEARDSVDTSPATAGVGDVLKQEWHEADNPRIAGSEIMIEGCLFDSLDGGDVQLVAGHLGWQRPCPGHQERPLAG